ncbi:MAG TPA: phasin family protein [Xanthobacteraceae bacterium]|jgi:phasin|nr:phasin family protein [Xanthobacteraceae bacterium]
MAETFWQSAGFAPLERRFPPTRLRPPTKRQSPPKSLADFESATLGLWRRKRRGRTGMSGQEERVMAKDPFEQFAIPNEMRAFAEQSVAQARKAFESFMEATNQAMGQFQGRAQAAQTNATEIAHKSLAYAEQNFEATFEFAQKLMHAKDSSEIMAVQSEYLSKQMQALSSQVQDLGQSAAKIVVDAAKTKS